MLSERFPWSMNDVLMENHFPLSYIFRTSVTYIYLVHTESSLCTDRSLTLYITRDLFFLPVVKHFIPCNGSLFFFWQFKEKRSERGEVFSQNFYAICRRCCPSEQTFSQSTNYNPPESTSGPYYTIRPSRQSGIGLYCCSWCTPPYLRRMSPPSFCQIRIITAERTRSTVTTPSSS